mgnify:CR=1 FL=1
MQPFKSGPRGGKKGPGKGKPAAKKKTFFRRKKVCRFTVEHIEYIDYKDVKLLQQYILERAKILPRRISGNSARHLLMMRPPPRSTRATTLIPYTTD